MAAIWAPSMTSGTLSFSSASDILEIPAPWVDCYSQSGSLGSIWNETRSDVQCSNAFGKSAITLTS